MRIAWFLAISLVIIPSSAQACVGMIYENDQEQLDSILKSLSHADVALEGIVERSGQGINSLAVIKPYHVWFGTKQNRYYIRKTNDCDSDFIAKERVKVYLFRVPQSTSALDNLWRVVTGEKPEYRTSALQSFSWSLQFKRTWQAMALRARR